MPNKQHTVMAITDSVHAEMRGAINYVLFPSVFTIVHLQTSSWPKHYHHNTNILYFMSKTFSTLFFLSYCFCAYHCLFHQKLHGPINSTYMYEVATKEKKSVINSQVLNDFSELKISVRLCSFAMLLASDLAPTLTNSLAMR